MMRVLSIVALVALMTGISETSVEAAARRGYESAWSSKGERFDMKAPLGEQQRQTILERFSNGVSRWTTAEWKEFLNKLAELLDYLAKEGRCEVEDFGIEVLKRYDDPMLQNRIMLMYFERKASGARLFCNGATVEAIARAAQSAGAPPGVWQSWLVERYERTRSSSDSLRGSPIYSPGLLRGKSE